MKPTHTHVSPRRAPTAGWSGDGSGVRAAFTMVELLVVIVIIGIMAGMVLGALNAARNTAREAATKATIAKLNAIIMQKYESYMTRRVTIPTPAGLTAVQLEQWNRPSNVARRRLDAIRDLMRMEMPDAARDIDDPPYPFASGACVQEPALHALYAAHPIDLNSTCPSAQCLYMIVSMSTPEAMEQFSSSEIGTVTDTSGNTRQVFIDAWGRPIMFFRSAPGFRSPIQTGDPTNDHDPFDSRNIEPSAFHLIPLIYSAGADGLYGLDRVGTYVWSGDPYATDAMGRGLPCSEDGKDNTHHDNITNHLIEQR